MKVAEEITTTETLAVKNENIVHMPLGLLGLEKHKRFVFLANPEESPFLWLQLLDDNSLAFLVVSPFEISATYKPHISEEDVKFLDLKSPDDTLLFSIVTMQKDGTATANLKGPIVVNRHTLVGKQIIPQNASDFSIRHPLPVTN